MPSVEEWLSASWGDFRRRWGALMGALGVTSALTMAGVLVPLLAGGLAHMAGLPPRPVWVLAGSAAVLAALWLSTWAQAAATRAAVLDETVAASLSEGWKAVPRFAWALTLVLLVAGGGFFLLLVPGMLLTVLLFAAPFEAATGAASGMESLERSWARVMPRLGAVAGRILVASVVSAAPGWIPYVGWLIAPFWAPFGLVAMGRLAADLAAESPAPERPALLRPAAAVLSLVFVAAGSWSTLSTYRLVRRVAALVASGDILKSGALPDAATSQALLAVLQGQGGEEQKQVVFQYAVSLASAAATAPVEAPPASGPAPAAPAAE